jgi:hypothetical protein
LSQQTLAGRTCVVLCLTGLLGLAAAGEAQVGSGWTRYTASYKMDVPPDTGTRHTFSSGVHHFWINSSDPSTYPGRDSGPRSEMRVYNNYTSGQHQFQGEVNVESGSNKVNLFQVFGASSRATAAMVRAGNNGSFTWYSSPAFFAGIWGKYNRLNVIHNANTGVVQIYVNGALKHTNQDGGNGTHYFKIGVYKQTGMSSRAGCYWRNMSYYRK